MHRQKLRLVPLILLIASLPSCALAPPGSPPAAVTRSAEDGGDRRSRTEILRQIRAICPQPMTAAELTAAADHLEAHPEALPLVRRLDLFDRQSRICRGDAS